MADLALSEKKVECMWEFRIKRHALESPHRMNVDFPHWMNIFFWECGLKKIRLRFSFWPHMLLSWVSVIIMAMKLAYGPVHHGYTYNLMELKADWLHPLNYPHTPTKNVGHFQPANAHDPFHWRMVLEKQLWIVACKNRPEVLYKQAKVALDSYRDGQTDATNPIISLLL